jgi:hypothetical protein
VVGQLIILGAPDGIKVRDIAVQTWPVIHALCIGVDPEPACPIQVPFADGGINGGITAVIAECGIDGDQVSLSISDIGGITLIPCFPPGSIGSDLGQAVTGSVIGKSDIGFRIVAVWRMRDLQDFSIDTPLDIADPFRGIADQVANAVIAIIAVIGLVVQVNIIAGGSRRNTV